MKNPSRACQGRKADKMWREAVIDEYSNRCAICNKEGVNIHHIISRSNRAVRWFVKNGCPLCPLHHNLGNQSAHKNPLWFRDEMIQLRGVEWEKELRKEANKIWNKKYEIH